MNWDLPTSVIIDGKPHNIRNKCDYRVVLDTINALKDEELDEQYRIQCALFIFYEDTSTITDFETACNEMIKIINLGKLEENCEPSKPPVMDWEYDFNNIAPPVSRVLGYSVRDPDKYTHWYDFMGAYMEIGDCYFAQIISIRLKKMKGKKLEKYERELYAENKNAINLPVTLLSSEQEWLDGD